MSARPSKLVGQHGRALVELGVVSVLGIVATAGFQLVAINGLSPADFGLLAAFLALINVVAVGSAALRNSVAVLTADSLSMPSGAPVPGAKRRRWDSTVIEAVALGVGAALLLLVLSPWLSSFLGANTVAVLFTALAALPYFLFARAQGLLQGTGRTRAVVWWTTGSQLTQLALTVLVVWLAFGTGGVLVVVVVVAIAFTIGSSIHAARHAPALRHRPFSVDTSVVLLLSIAFAWLTNADVLLVRGAAEESVAGSYAAAGVLVKAILIVPATLGIYLLPRFVGRQADAAMTKLGVNVVLAITLVSGLIMIAGVLIAGGWLVGLLYPGDYDQAAELLPWLAVMWLPWAAAQGVLIRVTAARSRVGLVVLVIAVIAQWGLGLFVLPDVYSLMLVNGLLGCVVLVALFIIHMVGARTVDQPDGSSEPPMPVAEPASS